MSDQADRIEALLARAIPLLEEFLSSQPLAVEKQQPLDPDVWPDWYTDLYSLPNFTKPIAECQTWLAEKGITGTRADETASYVRSVWPGKGPRPWKDPWATFRTNVVRQFGGQNAKPRTNLRQDSQEQTAEDRTRAERLNQRRAGL